MSKDGLRAKFISFGALALLSLPALLPLFSSQLLASADGQLHLYRLVEFDHLIRSGIFFTRWMPDLAFGYGFPLFNYYAPLAYYLTEPLILSGVSFSLALNLSLALSLLVGAFGIYAWMNELTAKAPRRQGDTSSLPLSPSLPIIPILSAVAFLYAPYLLFNALARANLAEAWALAFAPWTLWAFTRLAQNYSRRSSIFAVLFYSAVLLSHNVTSLLFTIILIGYGVASYASRLGPKENSSAPARLRAPALVFLLALCLTAFFWLPALLEQGYVQIARVVVTPDFDYRYNFVALGDLVSLLPRADTGRMNTQFPATLGIVQVLLALVAVVSISRPATRSTRHRWLCFVFATFVLILLMLPVAEPIWARVPFLAFVQLPSRLRGLGALMLAPLAGFSLVAIPERQRSRAQRVEMREWFAFAAVALVMLTAFPMLYPRVDSQVAAQPTLATMYAYESESGALGTTSFGEYLPVWVETPPNRFDDSPRLVLPEGAQLLEANSQSVGLTSRVRTAQARNDARIIYRTFYFPGWRVTVDGQLVEILPTAREGLISFNVPSAEHGISIAFAETNVERIAEGISFVGVILLLAFVVFGKRFFQSPTTELSNHALAYPRPPGTSQLFTLAPILLALALTGIKIYGDHFDTPFVAHFDGHTVSGIMTPLGVNFGGELILLGSDSPRALTLRVGDSSPSSGLTVKLYWRAAHPLTHNFSVAVHLLDAQGNLVAQSDHLHPAQFPTTRWDVNAYVEDTHTLAVSNLAPGIYTLVVRAYDAETGKRLLVGNEDGFEFETIAVK